MIKSKGLRLIRRIFPLWQLRRSPTSYRRLESDRSPPAATKILRWVFSLKQRFYAPVLGGSKKENPSFPPKGHMAVHVGGREKDIGSSKRYFVPIICCNHPLFGELLREAEMEFGFHYPAGITIPCPASRFELVTKRIIADVGAVDRRRIVPHSLMAL